MVATRELRWRKASASGGTDCVEVAADGSHFLLRDSKAGDGGHVIVLSRAAGAAFLSAVRAELDSTGR
ncbi:DUF397 domain-containing protein [Spirillospora sp. CA-253888]